MPELPKLPKIDKNPIKTAGSFIREAVSGIQEAAAEIDSAVKDIDSEVRAPIEEGLPPIEEFAASMRSAVDQKQAVSQQKTTTATQEPPYFEKKSIEGGATAGIACTLCSSEHFDETANTLKEAYRMAPTEGLTSSEIRKRLRHARGELDVMERFDLTPEEVAKLPPDEKEIANWALPESRNLRHMINSIKALDDLKQTAAKAAEIADEFDMRLVKCRPSYFETQATESELPPEIEALRKMVEERKQRK